MLIINNGVNSVVVAQNKYLRLETSRVRWDRVSWSGCVWIKGIPGKNEKAKVTGGCPLSSKSSTRMVNAVAVLIVF